MTQQTSLSVLRSSFLFLCIALVAVLSLAPESRAQEADSNYRLCANDLIEIRVFQEPDLDSRVRIGGDGSVTLPLVGAVALGGKTVNEAADYLRQKYDERFLVNPQLTVTVTDFPRSALRSSARFRPRARTRCRTTSL